MGKAALFEKYGRSFKPGEVVFSEGDHGQSLFIIQQGNIEISKDMDGRKHVLSTLTKGEFFGEMAIVTRVKRTATATALDEVQLLAFDREAFQGMIEKNSRIALNVIDKLCRRLQHANTQIRHLLHASLGSAIALNLYLRFQRVATEDGVLTLDRTKQEIARNIEVDVSTVDAVVRELAATGVLRIEQNSLRLVDEGKLCRVADKSM
ncbi:MAG: Crp/Fnr family transcriptional regulator [Spirochaetales bacterium]